MAVVSPPARLLVEVEPRSGAWNMAFDEALLEAAVGCGETTLRIYRWSEPTLSLGHFQRSASADLPELLRGLPRVRRLSGGGAILHDREWTYSCAVPKGHRLTARPELLYDAVHAALVRAFARKGIVARPRGIRNRAADAAFLCFLRGDERDLIVGDYKAVGSAQRRRRGAVLQHGSVLLRASPFAPGVPGLLDSAESSSDDPLFALPEFVAEVSPELFDGEAVTQAAERDIDFADSHASLYAVHEKACEVTRP